MALAQRTPRRCEGDVGPFTHVTSHNYLQIHVHRNTKLFLHSYLHKNTRPLTELFEILQVSASHKKTQTCSLLPRVGARLSHLRTSDPSTLRKAGKLLYPWQPHERRTGEPGGPSTLAHGCHGTAVQRAFPSLWLGIMVPLSEECRHSENMRRQSDLECLFNSFSNKVTGNGSLNRNRGVGVKFWNR